MYVLHCRDRMSTNIQVLRDINYNNYYRQTEAEKQIMCPQKICKTWFYYQKIQVEMSVTSPFFYFLNSSHSPLTFSFLLSPVSFLNTN